MVLIVVTGLAMIMFATQVYGSPAGALIDGYLELDYYGGISEEALMLEDYLSYDGEILYYDYPGLGDHEAGSQDLLNTIGSLV